jgi:hypothetical protein
MGIPSVYAVNISKGEQFRKCIDGVFLCCGADGNSEGSVFHDIGDVDIISGGEDEKRHGVSFA